jgi:hypothetical protein
MDVRKSGSKKLPEITNNYGLQIDLSMFLGRKEKATGPWMIAYPQEEESSTTAAAPTGIPRFKAYVTPERRRIVAQVRRKVPKNRDFFAVQDSAV